MSIGKRPRPETVIRWARAIGEDERSWLEWCGYEFVGGAAGDRPTATEPARPQPSPVDHYAPINEELREDYSSLSEEDRQMIDDLIRRLAGKRREGS